MSKFKVGDKVKIKSWEQMFREYAHNSSSDDISYISYISLPVSGFSREMKHLCGETAIIEDIRDDGRVWLKFFNKDFGTGWDYSIYMLEHITDFYEKCVLGIWKNQDIEPVYFKDIKEEKEMNKVLNLWFERKQEKIVKKYAEMEQDFINNHYSVVKSYNELVEQFEKDLDDLYKFDKVNEQFVLEEISDKNTIKYDIDFDKLSCEFTDKHIKEKQGELKELAKIREEVEAQLSLSNELEYQQKVLIQYNIIDKKTKKIVE